MRANPRKGDMLVQQSKNSLRIGGTVWWKDPSQMLLKESTRFFFIRNRFIRNLHVEGRNI